MNLGENFEYININIGNNDCNEIIFYDFIKANPSLIGLQFNTYYTYYD